MLFYQITVYYLSSNKWMECIHRCTAIFELFWGGCLGLWEHLGRVLYFRVILHFYDLIFSDLTPPPLTTYPLWIKLMKRVCFFIGRKECFVLCWTELQDVSWGDTWGALSSPCAHLWMNKKQIKNLTNQWAFQIYRTEGVHEGPPPPPVRTYEFIKQQNLIF